MQITLLDDFNEYGLRQLVLFDNSFQHLPPGFKKRLILHSFLILGARVVRRTEQPPSNQGIAWKICAAQVGRKSLEVQGSLFQKLYGWVFSPAIPESSIPTSDAKVEQPIRSCTNGLIRSHCLLQAIPLVRNLVAKPHRLWSRSNHHQLTSMYRISPANAGSIAWKRWNAFSPDAVSAWSGQTGIIPKCNKSPFSGGVP